MADEGKTLDLASLKNGVPFVSPAFCASLAEAARVCLDERRHPRPVGLRVHGSFELGTSSGGKRRRIRYGRLTEIVKKPQSTVPTE
jgi:hypothetical protein